MKNVRIFHDEAAVFQVTAKGVEMMVDKVDSELNEPNIRESLLVCLNEPSGNLILLARLARLAHEIFINRVRFRGHFFTPV